MILASCDKVTNGAPPAAVVKLVQSQKIILKLEPKAIHVRLVISDWEMIAGSKKQGLHLMDLNVRLEWSSAILRDRC